MHFDRAMRKQKESELHMQPNRETKGFPGDRVNASREIKFGSVLGAHSVLERNRRLYRRSWANLQQLPWL